MQELSLRNPRVAQIRGLSRQRKVREETGTFVIEGPKLIAEAIAAGVTLHDAFVEPRVESIAAVASCLELLHGADVEVSTIPDEGLERLLATKSPQGLVAVGELRQWALKDLLTPLTPTFVVAAEDLNDPGNAGTMLRTALAAGADAFVALGASVDLTSPKVVRSSAGALFRLPTISVADTTSGLAGLREAGLSLLGAAGEAPTTCTEADLTAPVALIMGSEAHGLSAETRASLDQMVRIPLPGPVESLNVAMATAILTWEICRQRSLAG